MSEWTLAPLVALLLCRPVSEGEGFRCLEYQRLPYVSCMRRADLMRASRRDGSDVIAVCARIGAINEARSS